MTTFLPTGWCPGLRQGENIITTMNRTLVEYPSTSAFTIFMQPGEGLPHEAWTNPRHELSLVPKNAHVITVSYKDSGVTALDVTAFVRAWISAGYTGKLVIIPFHEPEQQTSDDPTPAEFNAEWDELLTLVPLLNEFPDRLYFGVCLTLQWARKVINPGSLNLIHVNNWSDWIPWHALPALGVIAGDWYEYDPKSTTPYKPRTYEPADSALAIMHEIMDSVRSHEGVRDDLTWGIREINLNGHEGDVDEVGCAAAYQAMHTHARETGAMFWTHFHKGGGDLTRPVSNGDIARPTMYDMLRNIILNEAARAEDNDQSTEQPDPNHPQYVMGYEAGWKTRDEQAAQEITIARSAGVAEGRAQAAAQMQQTITEILNEPETSTL